MSDGGSAQGYPGPATFRAARAYNLALAAAPLAFSGAVAFARLGSGAMAGSKAWTALAICLGVGGLGAWAFLRNLYPVRATLSLDAQGFALSRPLRRFAWADCREVEGGAFFVAFVWALDVPHVAFRTVAADGETLMERRILNVFEPKTADLAATMEAWRALACAAAREAGEPRA